MSTPRALLIGYYGKGNFGDDVLLKVSHALVKRLMPQARIAVVVDGDDGTYVKTMLGDVDILKPGRHGHFDFILHGGGGVFFDFKTYGLRQKMLECAVRAFGFGLFVKLEKTVRKLLHKERTSAARRLGFGIGVGTFSPGSPKLLQSLPVLADFDALWVRDAESLKNLERFKPAMHASITRGSDIAFLTDCWMKDVAPKKAAVARPRLGIVLRDWPEESGGTPPAMLQEIFARLATEYEITGFIFDRHSDPRLQALLQPYAHQIWQPDSMQISDFAQRLGEQDVLLSSRAHGAICGACLGVASVIVNIEPKMAQVHAMLPSSSLLVPANEAPRWEEALKAALAISPAAIASDVSSNRAASQAALQEMEHWFQ